MLEQETQIEQRVRQVGKESFLGLARKPVVQLVLVATAAAQFVNVKTVGVEDTRTFEPRIASVQLAPALVVPDSALQMAFLKKSLIAEAERLGSEYREEGFEVTPELARTIGETAAEFDINPEVAFGLVKAESSFRNVATSSVGAVGLTQLMPRTAAWMEPGVTRSELRDPETNLRIGFKYFRYLIDRYKGDEKLALLAYNRGPGTVDKALKRGRNPDNGYADFVYGKKNHGHRLFTR